MPGVVSPDLPEGFARPAGYGDGVAIDIEPGQLGAAYFIPTVVVPLLLTTHVLVFRLLIGGGGRIAGGTALR